MLPIVYRPLAASPSATLLALQKLIDAEPNYPAKVNAAKIAWAGKTSTKIKADAFKTVRETLATMCIGPVRCAYCEDSLADEVEHILPKNFFPQYAFSWDNYLFACGPCNGPKGNRYGVVSNGIVQEIVRKLNGPVVQPPVGVHALIDPRTENPMDYLELDMGGETQDGIEIPGTFEFVPRDGALHLGKARALFSIEVLRLNREVMRVARENAFGGFRARLREYADEKIAGAQVARLKALRDDILSTPHLTVFAEMQRQQAYLPAISALFAAAPEAENWALVPPP